MNCTREHGERGAAGVAQHVLVDDAVRAEAAAAERADVVARERVEHRSAHLLGDGRRCAPNDSAMIGSVTDASQPASEVVNGM